jgi:hypothetical protein
MNGQHDAKKGGMMQKSRKGNSHGTIIAKYVV